MLYGMPIPALPQQVFSKASNGAGAGCRVAAGSPLHKSILENLRKRN